jgi:manganese transport protein
VVIFVGLDPTRTLVLSQVVLSFGLPFAVIPLILFVRRRDIMGELVSLRVTTIVSTVIAALILSLNVYLIVRVLFKG